MHKPVIKGQRISLVPISKAHAQAMFASVNDQEGNHLTGTTARFSFEQVEAHCRRVLTADDRVDYAITLPDGSYVGEVVLNDIDSHNRSAFFRTALAGQEHYNRGYGSEAIALLLDFAFNTLRLHRIELEVFVFNPRAIHVYEKLGFVREGLKREVLLWDGVYNDAIVMAMLERDYRAAQR
jgi:RimJ/RimL family protein N-acetyltransferase